MTESDGKPDQGGAAPAPTYADRVYRSVPGVISGVLLLVVALWLIGDAVFTGAGRTPWIALAALPVFVPPVVAYTLRPAVLANDDRLLVRNPLRTIKAPWASVEGLKSGYSVELFAGGRTFQVWAVPVSLRQRKKATRAASRAALRATRDVSDPHLRESAGKSRSLFSGGDDPTRAWSDQVVDTLLESAERNASRPTAAGEITVAWCWWIIAPTLAGLVALITLIATT
ncbi:PH domain-containing protein [Kitasatospora sp. NPDC002227]|uniref:PH domain-containing protein n=1 Tax=Kitasatospora sp. NPDC002227 TaxID=3154773 RepID=UPI00332E537D